MIDKLVSIFRKYMEVEEKDYDTPFMKLGGDSLSGMMIIVDIEEQFRIIIDPDVFYNYNTINKMAAYIELNKGKAG